MRAILITAVCSFVACNSRPPELRTQQVTATTFSNVAEIDGLDHELTEEIRRLLRQNGIKSEVESSVLISISVPALDAVRAREIIRVAAFGKDPKVQIVE